MNLIGEEELLRVTGYSQRAALERWLTCNGVRFFVAKDGRLVTTANAVDAAILGGQSGAESIKFAKSA